MARCLGRSERRLAAARYVIGLLTPNERKSIEPMAARMRVHPQALQQFLTDSPWDEEMVWRWLRREIMPYFAPLASWLIVDSSWPKRGSGSVGVHRQGVGVRGKSVNAQSIVELLVSNSNDLAPVGGRLYLPESWANNSGRRRASGIPEGLAYQSRPELALRLIDSALPDGFWRVPVLAGTEYGDSQAFRRGLTERNLEFFVEVTPSLHWSWAEILAPKRFKQGHARPDSKSAVPLAELALRLPERIWQSVQCYIRGDGKRSTRLAWLEGYLAPDRASAAHGEKLWIVIDWSKDFPAPHHYYVANLHSPLSKARLATLNLGWLPLDHYLQLKEQSLRTHHFEGRSWRGFHHHLVLSAVACWFLTLMQVRSQRKYWIELEDERRGADPALVAEVKRLTELSK